MINGEWVAQETERIEDGKYLEAITQGYCEYCPLYDGENRSSCKAANYDMGKCFELRMAWWNAEYVEPDTQEKVIRDATKYVRGLPVTSWLIVEAINRAARLGADGRWDFDKG